MIDVNLHEAAKSWITEQMALVGVNVDLLEYTEPSARPTRMPALFRQMLMSVAESGMTKNVTLGSLNRGVDDLKAVTFGFSPAKTIDFYRGANRHKALFRVIKQQLNPRGELNKDGLWPKYCKSILSVAEFLSEFGSASAFFRWADGLEGDPNNRSVLVKALQTKIFGAGYAIACNILIDLGYRSFAKPDRHIKAIVSRLESSSDNASDSEVLASMERLAKISGTSPYSLDKLFFIIGSGKLYKNDVRLKGTSEQRIQAFTAFVRDL